MPESRVRRKSVFTAPPPKAGPVKPNGRLFLPTMLTLLVSGLIYIVVYYLSQTEYPIPGIGAWNLAIGFGIMLSGFAMTTRWR
jgi:hypothetical protein